ncbi:glutathione S-transferase family protein [Hirschia litorea]|uniref:Glutathione S-transferase family protein n=1 Tax=Hirschia litorea TaxID=1199156 RepID=A0ABW2IKJ2_9PROT
MSVKLYIGNKNYSSWSMRPWLCLKKAGISFEEVIIPLDVAGFKEKILSISSAGTVPILEIDGVAITESLAISEWAAEQNPQILPSDSVVRAQCRAAASLMHAGFSALRTHCPMNVRGRSSKPVHAAALEDAAKVDAFWCSWLEKHATDQKPFLFGDWSMADAFFAPVVSRFQTFNLPRSERAQFYIETMENDVHYQEWAQAGAKEEWCIESADGYLS